MINPNTFNIIIKPRASTPMKVTLGGKDAQGIESFRTHYPDFKIANNSFKIVNGLVLDFRGEKKFSPFFLSKFFRFRKIQRVYARISSNKKPLMVEGF